MALFQCNFISYTLVREVQINVILPTVTCPESMGMGGNKPTHSGKAPYPVLYLLHGFANNGTVWGRYTSVVRYAEERQIAVVTISADFLKTFYGTVEHSTFKILGKKQIVATANMKQRLTTVVGKQKMLKFMNIFVLHKFSGLHIKTKGVVVQQRVVCKGLHSY